MPSMTPLKKIVREGSRIYTVDFANNHRFIATTGEAADNPDGQDFADASWVANAIAGYHGVSLEESDDEAE